jgi:hypothetical protein
MDSDSEVLFDADITSDPVICASPVNGNGVVDMPVNAEPSPEYDPENDPENAELLLPNVNIAIF